MEVKRFWIRIIAICHIFTVSKVSSICQSSWISHGLYCYFYSDSSYTYEESVALCESEIANLVAIDQQEENQVIRENRPANTKDSFWIGYRRVIGSLWRWELSGSPGTFTDWDFQEPDGEGGCARMVESGRWRDHDCQASLRYVCKKYADCSKPPPVAYSTVTTSNPPLRDSTLYPANTIVQYTCPSGYEFTDGTTTKQTTCSLGGKYSPEATDCVPVKCKAPPLGGNMVYNGSSNQLYDLGTVIEYTCLPTYWFSQFEEDLSRYLTCDTDKVWRGTTITNCTKINCIRPITGNATTNTSSNREGVVSKYECHYGFKFYDNNETVRIFKCSDRKWVPPPAQCLVKRCPAHQVANARPTPDSNIFGTLVKWQCLDGMQYPDTSSRKYMYCQNNEEWDMVITESCERKTCVSEPPNNTETRTHNWNNQTVYRYEDSITYTCIEGWFFPDVEQSTSRNLSCNRDGEWSPKVIVECIGAAVEVKEKVYHPPTENEDGEVFGSLGIVLVAIVLFVILALDVSTISKHVAIMKANLLNTANKEKKQGKELNKEAREKSGMDGARKKVMTVIVTKNQLQSDNPNNDMDAIYSENEASMAGVSNDQRNMLKDGSTLSRPSHTTIDEAATSGARKKIKRASGAKKRPDPTDVKEEDSKKKLVKSVYHTSGHLSEQHNM